MSFQIRFPIKGCYYYDAFFASEQKLLNTTSKLIIKPEPDNEYDGYALQIWLELESNNNKTSDDNQLLIGYIPRLLAKQLNGYFLHYPSSQPNICHFAQRGQFIEIDCLLTLKHSRYFSYQLLILKSRAQLSIAIEQLKRLQRRFWYKLSAR